MVITPGPSQGKGLGRASSDNPLALPQGKGQGRASGDNPLALQKKEGLGKASSDFCDFFVEQQLNLLVS